MSTRNGTIENMLAGLGSTELLLKMDWEGWLAMPPPYGETGCSSREVTARYERNGYEWDIHGTLYTPEREAVPGRAVVVFHGGAGSERIMDTTPDGRPGLARVLASQGFVTLAAATEAVAEPEPAARRALGVVGLDSDGSRRVSGFSKGMRQRVKLAAALVHDPEVLILDEPLTGLDPVQRRRMIELFHGLGDEGRCVLVSSHVLEEVARLGSRILLIAQGRLAATGDYRELRELMDDRPHRIRIAVDRPRQFAAALVESGTAVGVSVGTDSLVVDTRDVDRLGREVAPLAQRLEARLSRVVPLDEDLESVFRYLVERR